MVLVQLVNRLTLAGCNCTVTVSQNNKTVASQSLTPTAALESRNTITFPRAGVYTMQVAGQPKAAGSFQPFFFTNFATSSFSSFKLVASTFRPSPDLSL